MYEPWKEPDEQVRRAEARAEAILAAVREPIAAYIRGEVDAHETILEVDRILNNTTEGN